MYNDAMSRYRFTLPMTIRYGDLDPQGHVNNARYLTFFEQARVKYFRELGLFDGQSFMDLGVILASTQIDYYAPIHYDNQIRVGVRVSRLGRKSFDVEHRIDLITTEELLADGKAVLVTYDYRAGKSITIPDRWREVINAFENGKNISQ